MSHSIHLRLCLRHLSCIGPGDTSEEVYANLSVRQRRFEIHVAGSLFWLIMEWSDSAATILGGELCWMAEIEKDLVSGTGIRMVWRRTLVVVSSVFRYRRHRSR